MNDPAESTIAEGGRPALERLHGVGLSDDVTLSDLYEAHRAELFAFAIRMTRDREAAEDLLQDVFLRLIAEARAGRMPALVRPWLYRVAANQVISRGRRGAVLARLIPRLVDRRDPVGPEADVLRSEQDAELHTALTGMAPDERAAMLLAAHGFTGQEIATSIGRSEGATRTLLCRSRLRLRRILEAAEVRP